jgi:hypothetical protein
MSTESEGYPLIKDDDVSTSYTEPSGHDTDVDEATNVVDFTEIQNTYLIVAAAVTFFVNPPFALLAFLAASRYHYIKKLTCLKLNFME